MIRDTKARILVRLEKECALGKEYWDRLGRYPCLFGGPTWINDPENPGYVLIGMEFGFGYVAGDEFIKVTSLGWDEDYPYPISIPARAQEQRQVVFKYIFMEHYMTHMLPREGWFDGLDVQLTAQKWAEKSAYDGARYANADPETTRRQLIRLRRAVAPAKEWADEIFAEYRKIMEAQPIEVDPDYDHDDAEKKAGHFIVDPRRMKMYPQEVTIAIRQAAIAWAINNQPLIRCAELELECRRLRETLMPQFH